MANISRYEPWSLLNQLHNEMNGLFGQNVASRRGDNGSVATSDWVPAIDIKEEKDRYLVHADIPGVDPNDIEIHMENGILSIKGQRETEKKEEREGYKRIERSSGSFFRSLSLPDTIDTDNISAKSKNGVLELVIPKVEKASARKIRVDA